MLVSIDPGVKVAGVACWDDGELADAFLVQGKRWVETASTVAIQVWHRFPAPHAAGAIVVAVEKPQIYHQSKLKGDPNDLIDVALMAGAVTARVAQGAIVTYLPREWKGSVPKDVMVDRIKARLTTEEHLRVELPRAKGLQHNVWDAVGIGLHHIKRLRGRS